MSVTPAKTLIATTDYDADSPVTVTLMAAIVDNIDNAAPVGAVIGFAGPASEIPVGWVECDGSALSRSTYATLFSVISTQYGVGDGSTTFNIPDFKGCAIIGEGTGSGLTARTRGDTGGEETHLLTTAEMPNHRHSMATKTGASSGSISSDSAAVVGTTQYTNYAGSSGAHNNMQPFGVAKFLIKTF